MEFNKSMTPFQEFIYTRTYSRWIDKLQRRETYSETVDRYAKFFIDNLIERENNKKICKINYKIRTEINQAMQSIHDFQVMPSMRALWTAGEALRRENLCAYNCSALLVDSLQSFSETLYILMNGCGVGFSVERQFINKIPQIPENIEDDGKVILFRDSKRGWAEGYSQFLNGLFSGKIYSCDFSLIRPAGSRLKVFGGRASGKFPLVNLVNFTKNMVLKAKGRRLNSLECHDIMCYIASVVIVGGVRRASCISFSNLSDQRMAHAKDGEFWLKNSQRSLSNNSTAYTEKPSPELFLQEWLNLMRSQTGERGFFNREGTKKFIKEKCPHRDVNQDFISNPCGEAILRPNGLCNLSEVVVRSSDSLETLKEKVKNATILGCLQSTLTDFKFVNENWKKNTQEERLLGVSLTGLRDHKVLNSVNDEAKIWLSAMRKKAWQTAKKWSEILNINPPASICLTKPSGTVSLLVDSASGVHTRFSKYYIRRVRVARTDLLCKFMIDQGVPFDPETNQKLDNYNTAVFKFPIKAPDNAKTNDDIGAIESLEYYKMIKEYWCDMNPSVTIFVDENEWLEAGAWVYKNWNSIGGLTFLPKDEGIYLLAPYEKITESQYYELSEKMPYIDFKKLSEYETTDQTQGSQILACTAGACEI